MTDKGVLHSSPLPLAPWTAGQVGQALLALVGLWVGVGLLFVLLGLSATGSQAAIPLVIASEAGLLALAWWFGPRASGGGLASLGFRVVSARHLLGYGLIALLGSIAFTAFYLALMQQIGWDWLAPPPLPETFEWREAVPLAVLALVVVGPLAEEVYFRGFMFAGLARKWGVPAGAVGSALVFAVLHGEVALLAPAFASGLLFAWVYRTSGSLWPSVLAHTVQNGLALGAAA